MIGKIGEWFDHRLQLAAPIREAAEHPVPRNTASWFYVFGSAALTVFLLQLVTGILLALIYVPSAGEAWSSLQALNHQVALGWFIRAMHGWGSNFMVAIVLIHMAQVFLFGAHKFPRELTWVIGVFLLLMTLGMAFSGQVLRFDQDAYWGLGIGASIASRVPIPRRGTQWRIWRLPCGHDRVLPLPHTPPKVRGAERILAGCVGDVYVLRLLSHGQQRRDLDRRIRGRRHRFYLLRQRLCHRLRLVGHRLPRGMGLG